MSEPADPGRTKSPFRDYAETILICVIFVIFTRAFVFQQSKIPSGSMMDTLLVGDYIMVNRFVFSDTSFDWEKRILPRRELRRGDVVVFRHPDEPEIDYIKRLIGLPGDEIELRGGELWVNGHEIAEPYVRADYRRGGHADFGPIRVPPRSYFMMGDHRNASFDSRDWGFVDRGLIKGRALLIWYSFAEDPRQAARPGFGPRIRSWIEKAIYFVPRSRWERCFRLIR